MLKSGIHAILKLEFLWPKYQIYKGGIMCHPNHTHSDVYKMQFYIYFKLQLYKWYLNVFKTMKESKITIFNPSWHTSFSTPPIWYWTDRLACSLLSQQQSQNAETFDTVPDDESVPMQNKPKVIYSYSQWFSSNLKHCNNECKLILHTNRSLLYNIHNLEVIFWETNI